MEMRFCPRNARKDSSRRYNVCIANPTAQQRIPSPKWPRQAFVGSTVVSWVSLFWARQARTCAPAAATSPGSCREDESLPREAKQQHHHQSSLSSSTSSSSSSSSSSSQSAVAGNAAHGGTLNTNQQQPIMAAATMTTTTTTRTRKMNNERATIPRQSESARGKTA
eukprot:2185353-Amphidinium_carterae.1